MLFKCWFVLIVLPSLCFGQDEESPSITKISSSQIKSVGEDVELECVVTNLNNYVVVWQLKSDSLATQILTAGFLRITANERYSLNTLQRDVNEIYTLKIKNVQENDAGTYQCLVSSLRPTIADVVLTVQPSSA